MIRSTHGLQPSTTLPERRHSGCVNIAVLGGSAFEGPVDRGPVIRDLRLRAALASWGSLGRDHVAVRCDLGEKVAESRAVCGAAAFAPGKEGHAEVVRRRRLGCIDGVVREAGVGGHLGRVGTRACCYL